MGRGNLHILMILPSFAGGGVQSAALNLVRGFGGRFTVTVASFEGGGAEDAFREEGAAVKVLDEADLAAFIPQVDPDVIHSHDREALVWGLAAGGGRPLVYTRYHDDAKPLPASDVVPLVVTTSQFLREELALSSGLEPELIRVIPIGVDPKPFLVVTDPREEVRAEFGFPPEARMVVGAGRLVKEKGFDLLAAAAPAVIQGVPDAVFLLAGEGPEKERLLPLAVPGKVVLAGNRPDVPRLLLAADVVAVPSRMEEVPLMAIEAAAAARATVVTDVGAAREVVEDGVTGHVVPPGDVRAMVGALSRLLAGPVHRRKLARAAGQRFLDHYTAELMARRYEEVYRTAVRLG